MTYSETLGTQLENVRRQLDSAQVGGNGALVSSSTNSALFTNSTSGFIQPGVFRFKTLNVALQATLDRDLLSTSFTMSTQTATGGAAATSTSTDTKSFSLQWTHQLQPDLIWSSSASYSQIASNGGIFGGNTSTIITSTGLSQTITDTLTGSLRYSFFKRNSGNQLLSLYQNMIILGVSKQF